MISPNEPEGRSTAAVALTPYARRQKLFYEKQAERGAFLAVVDERFQAAADAPGEFYARASAVVAYLTKTQQALWAMPGREFFRDPAEEFVSAILGDLEERLRQKSCR